MNKIYILLLIIISLIVWRPVFDQVPMGEGYYYFDRCQNKFVVPNDCPTTIWQYDNLARISFQLMVPLFRDNIHLYMFTQMGVSILLYIVMYLVLFKITKNSFFSFATVLMFLSSHTGSFSMMAIGNYQRFVQRVPNLIFIFASFLFLTKYLDSKKVKNVIYFGILYLLALYLSHHSIFILPLFVVYIFVKSITKRFILKEKFIEVALILFIVFSSLLLTKTDHFVPKVGIVEFIKNTPNIVDKTLLQIPNIFIPTELIRTIAKNWPVMPIPYPFTFVLKIFLLPILIILVLPIILTKDKSHARLLYTTAVISLPFVCFLNLYAYGEGAPHPLRDFGEDRIYFIPSIFTSIILGYIVNLFWNKRSYFFKTLVILSLILSILHNQFLIKRDADKLIETSNKMEDFIEFVKYETWDRNIKMAMIGPSHLFWPMQLVTLFYGDKNNLSLALDSTDWKENILASNFDKILLVDYKDKQITKTVIK